MQWRVVVNAQGLVTPLSQPEFKLGHYLIVGVPFSSGFYATLRIQSRRPSDASICTKALACIVTAERGGGEWVSWWWVWVISFWGDFDPHPFPLPAREREWDLG
jgi:hypothetical protein